jgi:hypothetical protein
VVTDEVVFCVVATGAGTGAVESFWHADKNRPATAKTVKIFFISCVIGIKSPLLADRIISLTRVYTGDKKYKFA